MIYQGMTIHTFVIVVLVVLSHKVAQTKRHTEEDFKWFNQQFKSLGGICGAPYILVRDAYVSYTKVQDCATRLFPAFHHHSTPSGHKYHLFNDFFLNLYIQTPMLESNYLNKYAMSISQLNLSQKSLLLVLI